MKNKLSIFIKKLTNSDKRLSIFITISFQLLMTIIGFLIESKYSSSATLLSHTMKWDAGWYIAVINDHYLNVAASPAFYPLFPLMVGVIHFISFGLLDFAFSGLIINTVALYFIVLAFLKISNIYLPDNKRYLPVILFLSFPSAFFLHAFYTESVFMALGMWAYLYSLNRKWLKMALLLALLSATRLPSILYIGLCFLEYLRSYKWSIKNAVNPNILYFLISILGFITYGLYLLIVRGDFLLMFHAYGLTTDWSYQIFDPNVFKTWAKVGFQIIRSLLGFRDFNGDIVVNHLIPLLSIAGLLISSAILIKKGNTRNLGLIGIIASIFFSLNGNLVSVHRYVLTLPILFIAIPILMNKLNKTILFIITCLFISAQFYLYYKFIFLIFAG